MPYIAAKVEEYVSYCWMKGLPFWQYNWTIIAYLHGLIIINIKAKLFRDHNTN